MDGGTWWAAVHGVTRSRTRLSDFTFTFHFHALEKEMATHSSVFAWRIPGTGEPGGLPSLGSHRVGHDWSDLAAAAVTSDNHSPLASVHLTCDFYPSCFPTLLFLSFFLTPTSLYYLLARGPFQFLTFSWQSFALSPLFQPAPSTELYFFSIK